MNYIAKALLDACRYNSVKDDLFLVLTDEETAKKFGYTATYAGLGYVVKCRCSKMNGVKQIKTIPHSTIKQWMEQERITEAEIASRALRNSKDVMSFKSTRSTDWRHDSEWIITGKAAGVENVGATLLLFDNIGSIIREVTDIKFGGFYITVVDLNTIQVCPNIDSYKLRKDKVFFCDSFDNVDCVTA